MSSRHGPIAPFLLVLCLGLNLRLGITGASPLLGELRATGALSDLSATLVASMPVFLFAFAGIGVVPLLQRRGVRATVGIALALLTGGLAVRAIPHGTVILIGTICAAAGIAAINIVLPAIIRDWFADRGRGVTTGYTSAMALGAAIAAAVALPLAEGLGAPTASLAFWALPALATGVLWVLLAPRRVGDPAVTASGGAAETTTRGWPRGTVPLLAFFALQTMLSYIIISWLPQIAAAGGIDERRAGLMLGLVMAVGVPATALIVPAAGRHASRVVGVIVTTACAVSGAAGLLLAPTAAPEAWAVLIGIGMSGFPFALALLSSIGDEPAQVARVSSLTQVVGYLLGGVGPLASGWAAVSAGSWQPVVTFMIAGAVLQGVIGIRLSTALRRGASPLPPVAARADV